MMLMAKLLNSGITCFYFRWYYHQVISTDEAFHGILRIMLLLRYYYSLQYHLGIDYYSG